MTIKRRIFDVIRCFCNRSKEPDSVTILISFDGKLVGAIDKISVVPREDKHFNVFASRARFDRKLLPQFFHEGYLRIQAQNKPFQIEIKSGNTYTKIVNCWAIRYMVSYQGNDYTIVEGLELEAETVEIRGDIFKDLLPLTDNL